MTYRRATGLTADPQLLVDAGFNLAVALVALADVKDDFSEGGGPERAEAVKVLAEVARRQEELLRAGALEQEGEAELELGDEGDDAAEEDGSVNEDEDEDEDGVLTGRAWEETGQRLILSVESGRGATG